MVNGLDLFREYFKDFQNNYVLIGGTACYIFMEDAGIDFRATKDLDIVLCAEAIDTNFVTQFWKFVNAGGYEHQEKSTGDKQFYRFSKPKDKSYPYMLELFSRKPDTIILEGEANLTPIPADDNISSLSAILLDDDYYQCIKTGTVIIDGISVLGPEYILPFKARAWLDLTGKKKSGEHVDTKDIKKHRNDIFRVFPLLSPTQRIELTDSIKADIRIFIEAMPNQQGLNIKNFGIKSQSLKEVLENIKAIYNLN
jgi:hypothetical protein